MPGDIYVQSDPPRMYKVMRQTRKTCFAFKILAAGRVPDSAVAAGLPDRFREHQADRWRLRGHVSPNRKDELKENADIVRSILAGA